MNFISRRCVPGMGVTAGLSGSGSPDNHGLLGALTADIRRRRSGSSNPLTKLVSLWFAPDFRKDCPGKSLSTSACGSRGSSSDHIDDSKSVTCSVTCWASRNGRSVVNISCTRQPRDHMSTKLVYTSRGFSLVGNNQYRSGAAYASVSAPVRK